MSPPRDPRVTRHPIAIRPDDHGWRANGKRPFGESALLDDWRSALTPSARVLLIQSDPATAEEARACLALDGHEVLLVSTGEQALAEGVAFAAEVVLLDLDLAGIDGHRVLRAIRRGDPEVPVLVLTTRAEEAQKVAALRMGADDYVTAPFGCMELLARVAALLRRGARSRRGSELSTPGPHGAPALQVVAGAGEGRAWGTRPHSAIRFGDVEVDPASRVVTRGDVPVRLKRKEFDLLLALVNRGGGVAARADLLREVWGYGDEVPATRTVDIHVAELRRKLEANPAHPRHILTVYKVGYRFEP